MEKIFPEHILTHHCIQFSTGCRKDPRVGTDNFDPSDPDEFFLLIKPKAFIVLHDGISGSEKLEKKLKDHVKTALAHYKYPRWIEFVDELPKTATGKIKRFVLANQAVSQ